MAKVLRIKSKSQREAETSGSNPSKAARGDSGKSGAKVTKVASSGKGSGERATAGKYTGKTSGLGVTKFQNLTLEQNMKKRLTDDQLAALWKKEFPNATADYDASTVKGVRGLYNRGKHGNDAPRTPVPEFDASGEALPFRGEKTAAKREASEQRKAQREAEERNQKKNLKLKKKNKK